MRKLISAMAIAIAILFALPAADAQTSHGNTLVIVYKDGHRQSVNLDEIVRLEFPGAVPAGIISTPGPSRARFLGRWEVGEGNGDNFYITLREDGTALRTMSGFEHERGRWEYVNGEADVTWDDGWQDCIRRVDGQFKKYAYSQGKTVHDEPDNVTNARNVTQNPAGVD
ncbi:MAG TPA: hypothetical protein VL990_10475 [Acidobacteriaceae bacterium]|nr:hypothetical protein [Acidobacteriaceae bacterium]